MAELCTSDFDYELPPELIAQEPPAERIHARMMVLERRGHVFEHRGILDLPGYLSPGDVLVMNDTRVIPARVYGKKAGTGGRVELLLLEELGDRQWDALYRGSGRARVGLRLELAGDMVGTIVEVSPAGRVIVEIESDGLVTEILESVGHVPLPPYIRREPGHSEDDKLRYQTVYAREPGAVAAPTAGLHFTQGMLGDLEEAGIGVALITLHVGIGTFRPVKAEVVTDHVMDEERFSVSEDAAALIQNARSGQGRVFAVGTTTVRTLETVAKRYGDIVPCDGRTDLFIYPPYEFRVVDALLTNFHLPCSTLLMMVSAFAGSDTAREAYSEAVSERYRFYSYGDCMLIR